MLFRLATSARVQIYNPESPIHLLVGPEINDRFRPRPGVESKHHEAEKIFLARVNRVYEAAQLLETREPFSRRGLRKLGKPRDFLGLRIDGRCTVEQEPFDLVAKAIAHDLRLAAVAEGGRIDGQIPRYRPCGVLMLLDTPPHKVPLPKLCESGYASIRAKLLADVFGQQLHGAKRRLGRGLKLDVIFVVEIKRCHQKHRVRGAACIGSRAARKFDQAVLSFGKNFCCKTSAARLSCSLVPPTGIEIIGASDTADPIPPYSQMRGARDRMA